MTLLFQSHNSFLIDHCEFVAKIYKEINFSDSIFRPVSLNEKLFCIKRIIRGSNNKNRKRRHDHDKYSLETEKLKNQFDSLKPNIPQQIKEILKNKYDVTDTKEIREIAQGLFESTKFNHVGINGGNNSDKPVQTTVAGNHFYIPAQSRFYCGCVKEQCLKLNGNKYDILVADPPWWNKYIRRLKSANDKLSYSMMFNEDIASLPVKNLLSPNSLIAVWCTNAPSCIEAVTSLIFPSWGVEFVTTWYWLKVTVDMEPVCDFSSGCNKQPYERLIIGKVGHIKEIPVDKIIISVPSALHSHKPPLLDLLKPLMNSENIQVLELFARYLLPNTTSVGYEPLKWQHESLYELVKNKGDSL